MVVNGLSKLSFKLLLLAPNLLSVIDGLSGSLAVARGILFCFHMTQIKRGLSGSLMVAEIYRTQVYPSDPVVDCL